ncbi:zinc-dependent metalloprotease [Parvicella tangerina]|uniref:T9SS C-terminal target domain-containing protein n=1 Tax=Parvicella tangerina TaxID=2829795 RepID=A0A916JKY5_9FLAO|nr:zinc-dependent metalloprotease [Parvicella tangerina]CAG5078408.1 hypothetical protein CRYO30217_00662 [Parvicella tangerina]
MKRILLSALLLGTLSLAMAQDPADYVMGTTGVINDAKFVEDVLENKYPGFKEAVQTSFDNAHQFSTKSGQVHEVNVVVHVVYSAPEINLPDSVIYNQMDILNADYNRTNADSMNLRTIFQPIAGNPHIHFNLVSIERVSTTATFALGFAGMPDEVKQSAEGGSDAWDTEHFLNIWVCKLENSFGALFGYAYPPAGLSNWPSGSNAPSPELDGVVLDYRTVGNNNPNPYPNPQGGGNFDLVGRTAVHEVGHYLGLRHIWGDGGGLFGGESCGDDDGMNDTPNQGYQSEFNCDTTLNTCIDSVGGQPDPNDLPDLIENHMDYSAETCKNMFTVEQAMHMRGVLENERVGLLDDLAGVEESSVEFGLYPNPAREIINVYLPDSRGDLMIYDAFGRLMLKVSQSNELTRIDCSNWSKGIYYISYHSENVVMNKTFVKE